MLLWINGPFGAGKTQTAIAQVADHLAGSAGLSLAPNSDGKHRGQVRRAWIGAKQIHFVKTRRIG